MTTTASPADRYWSNPAFHQQLTVDPRTVEALAELRTKMQSLWLGFVGYRTGRNYWNLTHDWEETLTHAVIAVRRWFFWIIGVQVWLLWLLAVSWLTYLQVKTIGGQHFHDFDGGMAVYTVVGWIGLPIGLVLSVLVPYVRHIDYSLFKRRWVYHVVRPLAVALDGVPLWVLYVILPCGLFFPFGWFG